MVKFCVLVFVLLAISQASRADRPGKLFLTVYYESDCPDSKSFILEQLQRTIQLLDRYLMLRLVPFGKAKSLNNGYNGFECQHGAPECLGNMIQDCALDIMSHRSDAEKVDYVACEMYTKASTMGDLKCVKDANLPTNLVQECLSSGRGTELQLLSEYYTSLVRPQFIPTVTINNVFNQQIQDHAQVDLTGTLCSLLKEAQPCAEYYNNMAMAYVFLK